MPVERIVGVYLRERLAGERFIDSVRRLGHAPFKAAFLAVPTEAADAAA